MRERVEEERSDCVEQVCVFICFVWINKTIKKLKVMPHGMVYKGGIVKRVFIKQYRFF